MKLLNYRYCRFSARIFWLAILFIVDASGCKKLIEVPPPVTSLTSDNVFTNDAAAASVLTGIYTKMSAGGPLAGVMITSVSLISGLSADELTLYGGGANSNTTLAEFYTNTLSAGTSATSSSLWASYYAQIYVVNLAIERLNKSNSLTPAIRQHLLGEAEFLRAFFYFYLTNLYGDIPLATSSDYTINSVLKRTPQKDVYKQIIADLLSAQNLLTDSYLQPDDLSTTSERVRPNKWAATALLARVYLYAGDSADAILQSSAIINTQNYGLAALNTAFQKNSIETIWSLQPVNIGWNTEDAKVFILPASGPTNSSSTGNPVYLSPQLMAAFEPNDQRRINWIDSVIVNGNTYYYAYKYKSATLNAPVTEYLMVLRLAEQYLIRAEAEANNNDISDAIKDLNVIRNRAGLANYQSPSDQRSVLNAIMHERQTELFTEWGHRWLDLKRTNSVNDVMSIVAPAKGTTWNPDWQWYPIPAYDIVQDPNLTQNAGY